MYYAWKNIKMLYKNNKFKMSSPKLEEVFELPNRLYSISHISDYFEYISKNMEKRLIFQ